MEIEKAKIAKRIIAIVALVAITVGIFVPVVTHSKNKKPETTTTKVTTTAIPETTTEEETTEEETTPQGGGGGTGTQSTDTKSETVAPKPVSRVVYTGGALPYCDYVDNSYFDEAVFIGDSVSLKLRYYASNGSLGAANLNFCVGNFGSANALRGAIISNVWDQVAATGRKRVYIMLGMNDLNAVGIDGAVNNMRTLCYKIQNAFAARNGYNPLIYIQSMTPINQKKNGTNGKVLNNANIAIYNQRLSSLAASNGWYFVDVASVMYNDAGFLRDDFCGDPNAMGLHFSAAGCAQWVWYLHTHAYDPSWAVYPLTIRYHKDGNIIKTYSEKYKAGDTFNIASDPIADYTVDKANVTGTFGHAGQEYDVYYTPVPKYTLTIQYVKAADGSSINVPNYTGSFKQGETYSVTTPNVEGFTPDRAVVSGTMGAANLTVVVKYTENTPPQTEPQSEESSTEPTSEIPG